MSDPTPVAVQGFTWTAALVGLLNVLVGGGIGVALVKVWPRMRELKKSADEKMRDDLMARVSKLEKALDRERIRHEAERALDRHKINNLTQCFDAVILLLEAAPERAPEIVTRVKQMREAQILAEAAEKAGIYAAEIAASAAEATP